MHTEILCNHGEISPYCAFTEETTLLPFPFTASELCCSACEFLAGDVQVYHWPISTAAPYITKLVNFDGFTL
jgi:hypothetical protein